MEKFIFIKISNLSVIPEMGYHYTQKKFFFHTKNKNFDPFFQKFPVFCVAKGKLSLFPLYHTKKQHFFF